MPPSPIKSNKPPQIALSTAGGQLIQIRMPSTPGSSSTSPAILGRSQQIQITPPSSVSLSHSPKIQLPSVPLPQSSVSVGPALSAKNAQPTVTMANGGDGGGPKIRYKCPFCPFSSDSQAPVHSHLKAKKYRCPPPRGCGFITCSKEAITQHQMDKHGKTHIQLEQQERQDRQEQQAKRPAAVSGPAAVAAMSDDGGPAAKKRNIGRSPSGATGPPPPILSSPPPLPTGLKLGSSGMAMIQLPTTPVPPPQLMDATATADLPGLHGIKLPQHPTPPTNPLPPPPPPLTQTPRQITTYTCAICRSYNATTEAAVEEHARLAHNIQQHQLNLGSTGKRYLCQFCDFVSTTSKEEVVNHILSAHPHGSQGPATTYACPHCTYKSTVASEIERHVRESHTLNPAPVPPPPPPPPPVMPPEMETTRYACAYCNFVSDSVSAVQAHSIEVHNLALAGADEATEMLQTTQPPPPPLPQLPVDPVTAAGTAPAPLPMICPHCGAGFDESSLFKAHLDSHGNSALASSGATPPSTPSKSTPIRKGPKPSLRKNFCETCSLQLPDRNAYIAHNRANHPQRNKCQFCDYTSPRPYNVKAHTEQVHFGRKPHACDACDFKASRRSALEQHVQNKHPGHPPPPVGWKRPGEADDDDIPLLPIKVPGKVESDLHGENESPNRVLVQPANGSSNLNSLQFMLDDGPGTPTAAGAAGGVAVKMEHGQVTHVVGKVEAGSSGNDSGISSSNHSSSVVVDNLTYPSAQLGVMSDMNDVLNGYHAAVHDDINMVSAEETVVSSNNNEHGGQQFILSDVALEGQAGSVAVGPNGEQILATVDISSAEGQRALLDYSAAESFNGGGGQQVLASLDVEGMPEGNPLNAKPKKQFHRNQPTETELTCDLCGYLANSRYAKKRHVKLVHDKRKDYTCTLCNQMFGQHGDAKRHAASKHKISDGSTVKRLCFD